jgi:hypothetical protein
VVFEVVWWTIGFLVWVGVGLVITLSGLLKAILGLLRDSEEDEA